MKHVIQKKPRRLVMLPGESGGEYKDLLLKAKDRHAFEANRLIRNGWTAQDEMQFQQHGRMCGAHIPDGERLIVALKNAATEEIANQTKQEATREAVQEKLYQGSVQAQETPLSQSDDVSWHPAWDADDPGILYIDDIYPADER